MKAWLKILRVAVFNKEDARTPTKLTVSYRGWWHSPLLHVPLATEPLRDGIHATRKDGKITLIQRFPETTAPMFRVKGRNSKLVIRLYAGHSLRTQAKVTVEDLVSATAERVVKVPFEEIKGGKVEKAFLSVIQSSPNPTPAPPSVHPLRNNVVADPYPRYTFPVGDYEPNQARLKFLVQETYGPWPDPKEWLLPPTHTSQCVREEATSLLPLEDDSSQGSENDSSQDSEYVSCQESEDDSSQDSEYYSSRGSEDNSSQSNELHSSRGSEDDTCRVVDFPFISYLKKLLFDFLSSLFKTSAGIIDRAQCKYNNEGHVDASFVHLWNQVFEDHSSRGRECYSSQNEDEAPHQLADVDASFVLLWNQVFEDHSSRGRECYSSRGNEEHSTRGSEEPLRYHEADHDCETAEDYVRHKTAPNAVEEESPCEMTPLGTAEEYDGIKTPLDIEKEENCLIDGYSPIPEETDDTQHSGEKNLSSNVHSAQNEAQGNKTRHRRKQKSFKSLESPAKSSRDTDYVRGASFWDCVAKCAAVVTVGLIIYNHVVELNKYYW